MEELIKEVASWLFKNYPEVIIALVILAIFLYFFKEIKIIFFTREPDGETTAVKIKHFFFPWTKKKKKKKVEEPKNVTYSEEERTEAVSRLLIHNFFISVSNIRNEIPLMDFGYEKKSAALRDVIKIYVDTIEKYSANVIKNYKLDELSTTKLNEILTGEITKIEYEIYGKMKERLGDALYYKIIEDPIKGFKTRNAIFKEIFINGVLLISSQSMSVYHYDNYERASEILTSMYISLQTIVKNFEKVFKDYNGELDKYLL